MPNLQSDYSATVIDGTRLFGGSKPPGPPLPPIGGEPPDDGKMQARVAILEVEVRTIRETLGDMKADQKLAGKDLSEIRIGIARIEGEIKHRPTFKEAFALLSAMLVLVGALIIFQGHIQKYVGPSSAPVAASPLQKP